MNKFYKVSLEQYIKDSDPELGDFPFEEEWNNIRIPKRATVRSAGYDFYAPFSFELNSGNTMTIPTGIKVELDPDKVLLIAPRSSLGFKYRLQLDNTIGVIDSDYYNNNKNEGHIFIKVTNDSKLDKTLKIKKGDAFAQGMIFQYFLTDDDNTDSVREGGIGSTNGK